MRLDPRGWSNPESAEEALALLDADWHPASTRPCPTCDPISRLLGKPFGCARYRIEHPGAMHSWYGDPARHERRNQPPGPPAIRPPRPAVPPRDREVS